MLAITLTENGKMSYGKTSVTDMDTSPEKLQSKWFQNINNINNYNKFNDK